MTPLQADLREGAVQMFGYLMKNHWDGHALTGPDPGVRFNSRIWRFLKSYTRWWAWNDGLAYIQAQKYWIAGNTLLADSGLGDSSELESTAKTCAQFLLDAQDPDGYWPHPNPEWRGRIATVEGNYGAMGLLEVYRKWNDPALLDGAKKWYEYATNTIGLRRGDGYAAINYFAGLGAGNVPNVTVSALRTFALLADTTGDDRYLEHQQEMVRWLSHVQRDNGELPYHTRGPDGSGENHRIHFLCYQYNAFELINLVAYYELTGDPDVVDLMQRLASFVGDGVTEDGACRYDCSQDRPEVSYYTAAAAAALTQATALGLGEYAPLAERAYRRVLAQQERDGSMRFYSTGNYGILTDRRSYPRYLAMTMYLLLIGSEDVGASRRLD